MRLERAADLVRLAIRLQGSWRGLTLADIQRDFEVSRRTAERLRAAVEEVFGPLETVPAGEPRRRFRLRTQTLRRFAALSAEELAELNAAAAALDRAGLTERAAMLRRLDDKLRALLDAESLRGIEPQAQALAAAERPAMRPGPRPVLDAGVLELLRRAITARQVVAFDYTGRAGQRAWRRVQPYGLIYGNRAFLAGRVDREARMRLWRLSRMSAAEITGASFPRDPAFDLDRFTRRSFGTFQDAGEPLAVALRFAARVAEDVAEFVFHPDQTVDRNDDGSLTVRFTAGGIDEMCRHLVAWGTSVTIERPAGLRRRLREMCATLAAHHGSASQAVTSPTP